MSECIKPLIQEFLDQELSPPEMERVSSHCASCRDCGRELEDQRSVSQAVSSLGRKPLPVGFMQRLERRRASPAPSVRRGGFLPAPARAAAFALSACLVVLVAYDRLGTMFPVKVVSSASAPDLTLEQPVPAAPAKPSRQERAAALKLAKAPGAPLGETLAARTARENRARASAVSSARGAAPAHPALTNEELQAALEEQKKREGISVLPRQADSDAELRKMVAGIGDPTLMAAMRGAAPINGPTPAILAARAGAASVRGLDASSFDRAQAKGEASEAVLSAGASGLILRSDEERAALWAQRGLNAAPPRVDYAKKRLLLVVANDYKTVVEIAGVVEGADRVLVTYRLSELPEGATRRTNAPSYQYRAAPKSDKPVQFQRLP